MHRLSVRWLGVSHTDLGSRRKGMKQVDGFVSLLLRKPRAKGAALIGLGILVITAGISADSHLRNLSPFPDPTGTIQTFSKTGEAGINNAFFQSQGTNGRSCSSCHQASDAWSVTPAHIQQRFFATNGLDPIFRTKDRANCP